MKLPSNSEKRPQALITSTSGTRWTRFSLLAGVTQKKSAPTLKGTCQAPLPFPIHRRSLPLHSDPASLADIAHVKGDSHLVAGLFILCYHFPTITVTPAKAKRAMTTVTLNLSDQTIEQAQHAAVILQKPVEDVLRDFLAAVLPSLQDVPTAMQAELTKMTWLSNQALWQIAQSSLSTSTQDELRTLSMTQEQRALTPAEQQRLEILRQEYGRVTLCKARAYALLSLRGGKPLLAPL